MISKNQMYVPEVIPMLCSTVVPTINRPSLERAVKSVLSQDFNPHQHEVIVVNDSGRPLPETDWLMSSQVILVNTNRCERSVACNVGAAVARGVYLKILHDDDYLLPGALNALIEVAQTSGCHLVYGAHNRVDNEDRFVSVNRPQIRGNILSTLIGGDTLHLSQSLFKRETFFHAGGFDPLLKVREDYDLMCRMALLSDVAQTDQIVAGVRIGTQGSTTPSTETGYIGMREEHRIVREKILNTPGVLTRLFDSSGDNAFLRGRCSRAYLFSAVLNLKLGHFFTACSRLIASIRFASIHLFLPNFWRGVLFTTHWQTVEKYQDDEYFAKSSEDS
jgi:glycosyltransferase involved in cell wall biosynthesis